MVPLPQVVGIAKIFASFSLFVCLLVSISFLAPIVKSGLVPAPVVRSQSCLGVGGCLLLWLLRFFIILSGWFRLLGADKRRLRFLPFFSWHFLPGS